MNILQLAPLILAALSLCGVVGGFFAMRAGYFQQAGIAQMQAIDAMKAQIDTQDMQLQACTKRISRLEQTLARIKKEMEKRGIRLEINGETITFIEQGGRRVRTVEINMDEDKEAP